MATFAAVMFAGRYYMFDKLNVYVNTVYPIAVLLGAFILNITVKTYFEQKQKSFITKQFGGYISPTLSSKSRAATKSFRSVV